MHPGYQKELSSTWKKCNIWTAIRSYTTVFGMHTNIQLQN